MSPSACCGDDLGRRPRRQQLTLATGHACSGMRVGEDAAEVRVASLALAEKRHVRPAGERHLCAGDRADAEVPARMRELE